MKDFKEHYAEWLEKEKRNPVHILIVDSKDNIKRYGRYRQMRESESINIVSFEQGPRRCESRGWDLAFVSNDMKTRSDRAEFMGTILRHSRVTLYFDPNDQQIATRLTPTGRETIETKPSEASGE